MRVDAHPERTRHVCDFLALGEAAGGANIGLQDIDRPVDEDRSKAPAGKLGLAPGDRDTKGRLHLTIALQIQRGLRRALSTPPQPHGKNPTTPPIPKSKERPPSKGRVHKGKMRS